MIRTTAIEGSTRVEVIFTVSREQVGDTAASVVGDFNGWDPRPHPLRGCDDGIELVARVTLKAGERYAFRYLTQDGHWFNDDGAHGYERNGLGTENSIIDLTDCCPPAPDSRGADPQIMESPVDGNDPNAGRTDGASAVLHLPRRGVEGLELSAVSPGNDT